MIQDRSVIYSGSNKQNRFGMKTRIKKNKKEIKKMIVKKLLQDQKKRF